MLPNRHGKQDVWSPGNRGPVAAGAGNKLKRRAKPVFHACYAGAAMTVDEVASNLFTPLCAVASF